MAERPVQIAIKQCCRRICLDAAYFGTPAHTDDEHEWEPTGQTCCSRDDSRLEQQSCTCKSTRWMTRR